MTGWLYFLFFCSGASGLIYQVVWVRVFGNVFGNTIYSASLVVAVFMLGLGAGSYVVGTWADRRYVEAGQPAPLLRAYGHIELLVGLLGLGVSALLPRLGQLTALLSSYSRDSNGWYELSTMSHVAHGSIAVVLLVPITLLMGGTLTLLIRYRVGGDLDAGGWRIAVLYAVNTAGAALGCFLTDFALVPAYGLSGAQLVAVSLNVAAGAGALYLARGTMVPPVRSVRLQPDQTTGTGTRALVLTSAALALSGFAAMGMEILWFRHLGILLGEFRAVFSLLLTVILVGIGAGSVASGVLHRRTARPALWLIVVQGLFIVSTLLGLAGAEAVDIENAARALGAHPADAGGAPMDAGWQRTLQELWFNTRPILAEVGVPALLMGFAFPLGNAVVQRMEPFVGRRAGLLYLANTAGAVAGSLAAGFLLLPTLGIQGSATMLMLAAGLAIIPLHMALGRPVPATAVAMAAAGVALGFWLVLPPQYLIARALVRPADGQRLLTVSEGINEVISVTETPGRGRLLLTNGHPMSSTDLLSQRYMRALAHIPLLSVDNPETVLVMCFGVGNTAHAATLHPSVRRVEVVDLSRHVLAHAAYFRDANQDVLKDPRAAVFVNDGRHHLYMQRETVYDVITLEPPPITQAGMGALYSREFYARARMRLKPKGYLSQWLPVAGVPAATTLAMIRAFIDVFPQSVLLSGAHTNLLLIGVNDSQIEIDPARMTAALSKAPAVRADLERLDLGSMREIVGSFVGSAETLARATAQTPPSTDDRPIQEYGVRSLLRFEEAPPASIVDLSQVVTWCPTCFADGQPVPIVDGLDTYLALLGLVYRASAATTTPTPPPAGGRPRTIAGSAYLGAVVPESADLYRVLGAAFAASGNLEEALPHLRRSVELRPDSGELRYALATVLLETRQYDAALAEFRAALRLMPDSVQVRNNLGVVLASQGKLDEAVDQFEQALKLEPEFADARRNLAMARESQRRRTGDGKPRRSRRSRRSRKPYGNLCPS